jgi:hypothetical protein
MRRPFRPKLLLRRRIAQVLRIHENSLEKARNRTLERDLQCLYSISLVASAYSSLLWLARQTLLPHAPGQSNAGSEFPSRTAITLRWKCTWIS